MCKDHGVIQLFSMYSKISFRENYQENVLLTYEATMGRGSVANTINDNSSCVISDNISSSSSLHP